MEQQSLFDQPASEITPPPPQEGEGIVVGEVVRITFEAEDTGFVVGVLQASDRATEVKFVGTNLPGIHVGASVRLEGRWADDPTYDPSKWYLKNQSSKQFEVRFVRSTLPVTRQGVLRYIAGNVKGCGPARAEKIIAHFGLNCLETLASTPSRIREVFSSGKTAGVMLAAWTSWADRYSSDSAIEEVYVRLASAGGITLKLARRIVERFGPREAMNVVLHRPYDLCEVKGVGFKTADEIARGMGIALDDPTRVAAGVVYVLEDAMAQGHSALPESLLTSRARRALELSSGEPVARALEANLAAGTLVERDGLILTRMADVLERRVAEAVRTLAQRHNEIPDNAAVEIDRIVEEDGLSDDQANAVRRALKAGIFVLTGRPGAGKTTAVRTFLRCCEVLGEENDVAVAAPSGKAASRAAEVTGRPAMTIHRLLGVRFGEVRRAPLRHRWIVLDETSMCDLPVMDWLLRNLDLTRTSILLVGDVNQLPSVGHGQVLADLIDSGSVSTAMLTEVFRQSRESLIKVNANRILDGEALDLTNAPSSDFLFVDVTMVPEIGPDGFPVDDPDQSRKESEYARLRLRSALAYLREQGADPVRDIQVLTPMLKGLLGIHEINAMLQDVLNPNGERGPRIGDGTEVRVGDRIIQSKNDYDLGVFNGDQGQVVSVNAKDRVIRVRFPEQEVEVRGEALSNIQLSWAITVHRSQGSEFPYCILLYHTSHYVMLSRPLLYTAITRASRQFILVGNRLAIDNTLKRGATAEERYTTLRDLLAVPETQLAA